MRTHFGLIAIFVFGAIFTRMPRVSRIQDTQRPSVMRISIPTASGWHEIPNTQLKTQCPHVNEYHLGNCENVIAAWSGAIADTKRNRMIIWGGGHVDYSGNELYALDLNSLKMTRLNDPSLPDSSGNCLPANPDGTPASRHTYNGMAYLTNVDKMLAFNGSLACGSGANTSFDAWTNDLATLQWARESYTGTSPGTESPSWAFGNTADYDPNTNLVFATDPGGLYSYDSARHVWARLSKRTMDYHMSAVVDPVRRLYILFGGTSAAGGGILVANIEKGSKYQITDWNSVVHGCEELQNAIYPGLAYNPVRKSVVGWTGGDAVYLFNPSTRSCSKLTYPGGPGPAQKNGTFGRFRYFPSLGVFALVNSATQNAFLLRLDAR